ncbi:hypothetical protein ACWEOE_21705 [Amycolatopsis sp. NPDC004368]
MSVRFTFQGCAAEGADLIAPLRAAAPVLADTIGVLAAANLASVTDVLAGYRAPFSAAVRDGGFTLTHPAEDVVGLVLTALAGVIVFGAQHASGASEGFRAVLLAQLAAVLGVPEKVHSG